MSLACDCWVALANLNLLRALSGKQSFLEIFWICSSNAPTLAYSSARCRALYSERFLSDHWRNKPTYKSQVTYFWLSPTVNPPSGGVRATAPGTHHSKEEEAKDLLIAFESQPRRFKRLEKVCL